MITFEQGSNLYIACLGPFSGGSTGLPVDTGTYERLGRASYIHGTQ